MKGTIIVLGVIVCVVAIYIYRARVKLWLSDLYQSVKFW